MRISCNGCRILRKGCSEKCMIKQCLEWINDAEHQANATLFLAKFYGRAGLLNLINAAPLHLRPAVFKSLLYEACGRIVNPVYGSLGLLSTGDWARCQAAVDAVLRGTEIEGVAYSDRPDDAPRGTNCAFSLCDIRHVSKNSDMDGNIMNYKVSGRTRFKRAGKVVRSQSRLDPVCPDGLLKPGSALTSSESSSVETAEALLLNRSDPNRDYSLKDENRANETEVDLELSLAHGKANGFQEWKCSVTTSGNLWFTEGNG